MTLTQPGQAMMMGFSPLRGMSLTSVVQSGPVDPLDEFSFIARLQTHRGFGPDALEPLGLYQDVSCTIPATLDGDLIAAWRDEISGTGFTIVQADEQKQPTLFFDGDGKPYILKDGVDDFLSSSVMLARTSLSVFVSIMAAGAGGKYIADFGDPVNENGIISGFTANVEVYNSPRLSMGSLDASNFNVYDFVRDATAPSTTTHKNGVQIATTGSYKTTASGVWSVGGVSTAYYDGSIKALLISATPFSLPSVETISSFLQTL